MADIRVTCPACKTQLEIGAEFEGQEVECGTCLEVFTATTKKAKPKPTPKEDADDDKPAGRSGSGGRSKSGDRGKSRSRTLRPRDDDDDDYEHDRRRRRDDDDDDDDDYEPRRRSEPINGLALASVILGGVSVPLTCCCFGWLLSIPMAIAAIVTGSLGMKDKKGKPLAIVGVTLGIVSLFLSVMWFAIGVPF